MNIYYVYIWYVIPTNHVFYVGKGHDNRYLKKSKRNNTFNYYINNFECCSKIIESNLSEEQAYNREIYYINYYKSLNMADANYHAGGQSGGNVFEYMPEDEKNKFIQKMTIINKERCSTDEFKNDARNRMIERYSDENERLKQSKKLKEVWQDEDLRNKQRENRLHYLQEHPEVLNLIAESNQKKCAMEFNGEIKEFDSKKELFKYLKENYNITFSRAVEQDMFNNGTEYRSYTKKKSYMNGLKLYYI